MNELEESPLRVGVMGCSSFALRAMVPAVRECAETRLVCIASRSDHKAQSAAAEFGCEAVVGYEALLERKDIDAVYMPLPTGLHAEWCAKALEAGKHVLVEKSFAESLDCAERLIRLAEANSCLVFENFQFQTHSQWKTISSYMSSVELGEVHLLRSTFGFPPLPKDNFRWKRELGGGALLDAGAYVCKVSQLLLGLDTVLIGAALTEDLEMRVEKYGEAMFRNAQGQVAQVAFGFDYFYQCRVELLGTKGKLSTNRVFTAPPGFEPVLLIEKKDGAEEIRLPADNHYLNMWRWFASEVRGGDFSGHSRVLLDQARMLQEIRDWARG